MLFLAISSSIDSFGIGITYGIRNTKISNLAKFILFIISFVVSFFAVYFGDFLKDLLPDNIANYIGAFLLIFLGGFVLFQALRKNIVKDNKIYEEVFSEPKIYRFFIKFLGITIQIIKDPISSDLDKSNLIDGKEAIFLGVALSLDSFAIGISSGILGIHSLLFPILVSIFQLLFISFGNSIGYFLNNFNKIPEYIWSIISGILLIVIGIVKFF
jgi:putative sporulation protein YtaF